jgi:hypothetical protein
MPGSFVDTSALAKHYHVELGSDQVDLLGAARTEGILVFDPENP